MATHHLVATLPCSGNEYGPGTVAATAFSPDDRMLAVAGQCNPDPTIDGTLQLFDVADDRLLGTLPAPGWSYSSLAFSPDGKTLLAAGGLTTGTLDTTGYFTNAGVSYFDPVSQQMSTSVTSPFYNLVQMALSPDGRTAALVLNSGDDEQSQVVQLFDVAARQVTTTLVHHESNAVAFSADGRLVAATEYPDLAQVWNVASHAVVQTLVSTRNNAAVPFTTVAFSPDGRVIAIGDYQGGLTFWDATSGRLLSTLSCRCGSSVYSLTYNRDGSLLAMGTGDGRVVLFSP
jgi:WD40 repeat protein